MADGTMERVLYEVKKVIVGQDHLLERMLVALLARGHILIEGVPGLAKTLAIKTLAQAIGGSSNASSSRPISSRPIWSARASTTRRPASSARRSVPFSPTSYWPTRSTVHPPRCKAPCWR